MYFIAIDGGGTKTDIVLFDETGRVIQRVSTSASCPTSIGIGASFEKVSNAIKSLLLNMGLSGKDIVSLYAGIAGCGVSSIGNQYTRKMEKLFPDTTIVSVGSDIINVLNCSTPIDDGMALICGTGSSLFVRRSGELHQVGGWGYLLGDEGSGYDIGRMGLKAALMSFDGRGPKTLLNSLIEKRLGAPVQQCIERLYQGGKSLIASFAPDVFAAASLNDEAAQQIIEQAAILLRDMLITGSHYLNGPEYNAVLAGGVWKAGNGIIKNLVSEKLPRDFKIICPETPPVFGAAVQAMNNANIEIEDTFEKIFQDRLNSKERV